VNRAKAVSRLPKNALRATTVATSRNARLNALPAGTGRLLGLTLASRFAGGEVRPEQQRTRRETETEVGRQVSGDRDGGNETDCLANGRFWRGTARDSPLDALSHVSHGRVSHATARQCDMGRPSDVGSITVARAIFRHPVFVMTLHKTRLPRQVPSLASSNKFQLDCEARRLSRGLDEVGPRQRQRADAAPIYTTHRGCRVQTPVCRFVADIGSL
jgi:hypothetical protein